MKSLLLEPLTEIRHQLKHKSVFVLCGNIYDLFPCGGKLLPLPECLADEFKEQFNVVRFDVFNGFSGNLDMFEKASFDPAATDFQNNEYERLNRQINGLINQVPKMDRTLKQTDYKMMIIITMAHQAFNKNSAGRERVYLEMWASQPEYISSGNVVVLLTPNPGDLPMESYAGSNTVTIQVKMPEDKQIEYLVMTRNVLNNFNLFDHGEDRECIQSLRGLKYRDIFTIIKTKQAEPKRSFKDIVEEFKYGGKPDPVNDIKKRLPGLKPHLLRTIKGQEKAIDEICKAITLAFSGIWKRTEPISVLLFGPTGTGKSQVVKETVKYLYGSEENLVRYDMQNYMSEHQASQLLGAPPGYVGYTESSSLSKAVKNNQYAVLLLDEFEKAHWRIADVFLGIMGDGFFRDNQNNIVSFTHTIIFMTTNLLNMESLIGRFRREFINRLTYIIEFKSLSKEVCRLILQDIIEKNIKYQLHLPLTVTEEAQKYLLEIGYDPRWNARELERVVKKEIKSRLEELNILDCNGNGEVVIDKDKSGIYVARN